MSDTTTAEASTSLDPSVRRTSPAVRALPFLVALASPLILDNIDWNPFGGWKILVGFIILACVGRFAWATAERDPSDPRLALKLWHRPDQRALSAMTCLVIVSLPFILGTDFDPLFTRFEAGEAARAGRGGDRFTFRTAKPNDFLLFF